jgi:hypothetical protein
MSDYLKDIKDRRIRAVQKIGLKPGDLIRKLGYSESLWGEVEQVFDNMITFYDEAEQWGDGSVKMKTDMIFMDDIGAVHRKDDPWDSGEVGQIYTANGVFGSLKVTPPPDTKPIPEEYLYKGTYRIVTYMFKYGKYSYSPGSTPTCPNSIDPFVKKAGIKKTTGLTRQEAVKARNIIESQSINRWRAHPAFEAETKYNKTIVVKIENS